MISQQEKHQAIRRAFPHIPEREIPRVAQLIRIDGDLYRIAQIVTAYIRHAKTAYDSKQSGIYYGGQWQQARADVRPQVFSILNSWR